MGIGSPGNVVDSGGLVVRHGHGGYYWKTKDLREEHGPFESLVEALDDVDRQAGADRIGEPEDWLDSVGYEAAFPGPSPIDAL